MFAGQYSADQIRQAIENTSGTPSKEIGQQLTLRSASPSRQQAAPGRITTTSYLKSTGLLEAYEFVISQMIDEGWPSDTKVYDHAAYLLLKYQTDNQDELNIKMAGFKRTNILRNTTEQSAAALQEFRDLEDIERHRVAVSNDVKNQIGGNKPKKLELRSKKSYDFQNFKIDASVFDGVEQRALMRKVTANKAEEDYSKRQTLLAIENERGASALGGEEMAISSTLPAKMQPKKIEENPSLYQAHQIQEEPAEAYEMVQPEERSQVASRHSRQGAGAGYVESTVHLGGGQESRHGSRLGGPSMDEHMQDEQVLQSRQSHPSMHEERKSEVGSRLGGGSPEQRRSIDQQSLHSIKQRTSVDSKKLAAAGSASHASSKQPGGFELPVDEPEQSAKGKAGGFQLPADDAGDAGGDDDNYSDDNFEKSGAAVQLEESKKADVPSILKDKERITYAKPKNEKEDEIEDNYD